MKKIYIAVAFIIMIMCCSCGKSNTEKEQEAFSKPKNNSDWQNAYAEYLNKYNAENKEIGVYGVYIDDINNDGKTEMVIGENPFGNCTILYYNSNGLKSVKTEVISVWGYTLFNKDTHQIINQKFYGHTQGTFGSVEYYIYDWDGENYVESLSLLRDVGYYEFDDKDCCAIKEGTEIYGQAYINGGKVDNKTFELKLAEIEKLEKNSKAFPFVENKASEFFNDKTDRNNNTYEEYLKEYLYN